MIKKEKKIKTFHQLSIKELKNKKINLLQEKFNLQMQQSTEKIKKNHIFKKIRRDIARINTILYKKNQ